MKTCKDCRHYEIVKGRGAFCFQDSQIAVFEPDVSIDRSGEFPTCGFSEDIKVGDTVLVKCVVSSIEPDGSGIISYFVELPRDRGKGWVRAEDIFRHE